MQHYAGAEFKLLALDGQLVGRLYWQLQPSELRLIEITLLPEFRARGFGTLLVQHLQTLAAKHQLPMALQVACTNHRALALYQRLGFVVQDSDSVFYQMQSAPTSASQANSRHTAPSRSTTANQTALTF
jgi:ribosomal protein S18 acetylase RimI-like enzyme